MPPVAVMAAKAAVTAAEELPLEAGLEFERRDFYLLFATRGPGRGHGGLRREATDRDWTGADGGRRRRTMERDLAGR